MYFNNHRFLISLFLIILLHSLPFLSIAQNSIKDIKVTLDIKEEKFSKVLEIIEMKTNVKFCFNSDVIPVDKNVSVHTQGASLEKLLSALFKAADLDYKIINGQVAIIKPKKGIEGQDNFVISNNLSTEKAIIYDTIYKVIYDTLKLPLIDTLHLHDTVVIRQFDTLVYTFKKKKIK
jgi:hypothetical protein